MNADRFKYVWLRESKYSIQIYNSFLAVNVNYQV